MTAAAFLKQDLKFQWRQGIHLYYLLVTLLYLILLRVIPEPFRRTGALAALFSDPTVLGFFFSGVILYMEKEILPTLFITPLKISEYILSRLAGFLLISCLIGLILMTVYFPGEYNPFYLIAGLAASAPFFTLGGMLTALYFRDTSSFLIIGGLSMTLFFLPLLDLLPEWTIPVYLPTRSTLQLFRLSLGMEDPSGETWITFAAALAETALLYGICRSRIHRFTAGSRRRRHA